MRIILKIWMGVLIVISALGFIACSYVICCGPIPQIPGLAEFTAGRMFALGAVSLAWWVFGKLVIMNWK